MHQMAGGVQRLFGDFLRAIFTAKGQKPLALAVGMATNADHDGLCYPQLAPQCAHLRLLRAIGGKSLSAMRVRLDRILAGRTLLLGLLLLWPLILAGRPAYIADSASYLKGGKAAVEFVTAKLIHSAPVPLPGAKPVGVSGATAVNDPQNVGAADAAKGARSVTYSVAAYLLRWPGMDMAALAIVQIACAAFVGAVSLSVLGLSGWRRYILASAILAFATPLAPICVNIVPDIFSGLVIATIIVLTLFLDRISSGVRIALAALTAFSMTAHASVPPLAAGMVILGGVVLLARERGLARIPRAWLWLVAPPALGMMLNTAIGYAAFGEVSVAAKRFPTALTRSVVDGPARWYLEKHCATERYAVCEVFGTHIPSTINDFLFYDWGLNGRATPEQMDRIRAEEAEIVWKAALEYPGFEAYNLARTIVRQLFRYDLGKSRFKERLAPDAEGAPQLVPSGVNIQPVMIFVSVATSFLLAVCAGWIVLRFRRMSKGDRAAILLVLAGLIGNATVVVVFSSLSPRYQARVVWVLPLFVLGMAMANTAGIKRRAG